MHIGRHLGAPPLEAPLPVRAKCPSRIPTGRLLRASESSASGASVFLCIWLLSKDLKDTSRPVAFLSSLELDQVGEFGEDLVAQVPLPARVALLVVVAHDDGRAGGEVVGHD